MATNNGPRSATSLHRDSVFTAAVRTLGQALYSIRMVTGISQTTLAERIRILTGSGIDQSTISRIEQGKERYLNWVDFFAACRVLNCSPDHVFEHAMEIVRNERLVDSEKTAKEVAMLGNIVRGETRKQIARDPFFAKSEDVYLYVRRRIILGRDGNGTILKVSSLAEEFDASSSSVLDALRLLEADGCGSMLGSDSFIVPGYNVIHMVSIVGRRIEIEAGAALKFIADDSTFDAAIAGLKERHESMMQVASRIIAEKGTSNYESLLSTFVELDIDFHLALLEFSGQQQLLPELQRLVTQVLFGTQTMAIDARSSEVLSEHESIIEALESRDGLKIVEAFLDHMVGNARQWENLMRDRLSTDEAGKEQARENQKRFATFQKLVEEKSATVFQLV